MNIAKAIEILTANSFKAITPAGIDFNNAIKLGIEALMLICLLREAEGEPTIPLLKGETKE